ncbi:MAG: class I SAM-dependent methyltransferase [Casimicrobiaceae bacterium]
MAFFILGALGYVLRTRHTLPHISVRSVSVNMRRDGRQNPGLRNSDQQRQAFGSLVRSGVYSTQFEHSPEAEKFFAECIENAVSGMAPSRVLRVLECGCGTGVWLDQVRSRLEFRGNAGGQYHGFDLTPEMVDLARKRLRNHVPTQNIHEGDVLDEQSYAFGGTSQRFDLIFAYDLIQQLRRHDQMPACEAMLSRLKPDGVLVVFDHDRRSLHGLVMGAKKLLTRYAGIGLVPRYYCNATYPPLSRMCRQHRSKGLEASIRQAPDGRKRALFIRASSAR